jgi:hypothetical protein
LWKHTIGRVWLVKVHPTPGVKLTKKQADYLGVPVEGPCKPEHYWY